MIDRSVSSKRVAVVGAGGAALDTVMATPADVVVLPAPSRALAVSVCDPSATVVVSQLIEYGGTVSSVPICPPSTKNCTPANPTLSVAFAFTGTAPNTVVPAFGVVTVTVGGVPSGEAPVMSNASTTTM